MSIYFRLFVLLSLLPFWLGHAVAADSLLFKLPYSPNSENPKELVLIALKYEHAEGVRRNQAKAATLYCKAAKMGDADAQFFLISQSVDPPAADYPDSRFIVSSFCMNSPRVNPSLTYSLCTLHSLYTLCVLKSSDI